MDELILQDKYLMNFFTNSRDGLGYKEVKANTVSKLHFIVEDLRHFISESTLNKKAYKTLLKKFNNNEKELLQEFQEFLNKRIGESMNMALFINNNKSVTFKGVKINLFYPSGSITQGDKLFDENVFSVVQELPYMYHYQGKKQFSFRPDITFFVNGIFLVGSIFGGLMISPLGTTWTEITGTPATVSIYSSVSDGVDAVYVGASGELSSLTVSGYAGSQTAHSENGENQYVRIS